MRGVRVVAVNFTDRFVRRLTQVQMLYYRMNTGGTAALIAGLPAASYNFARGHAPRSYRWSAG